MQKQPITVACDRLLLPFYMIPISRSVLVDVVPVGSVPVPVVDIVDVVDVRERDMSAPQRRISLPHPSQTSPGTSTRSSP